MKRLLLAAAATIALSATVFAADLPARVYSKAPAMAPVVSNWTGCYVGGNIGGGWQKTTTTDAQFSAGHFGEAVGGEKGSGIVGGGQAGCDYQFASNWLVGIQGMFDGASIHASHFLPFAYSTTFTQSHETRTDWLGTLTGRVGVAVVPQALLYLKGGAAWVNSDYFNADPSGTVFVPYSGRASATRTGWTIGGGGEYLLNPNWSLFAEYNYIDLGTRTLAFTYGCGGVACGFASPFHFAEKQNLQTVLVGFNYRFK